MKWRTMSLAAAMLCLTGQWCHAQPRVSFPIQGYYRVGKYMPVRIAADAAATPVELRAEGAVTVSVGRGSESVDVVVPWLAVTRLRGARWAGGGASNDVVATFTPLQANEAAVGVAAADLAAGAAAAAELFPGKSLVPIALHASHPLPGDPAAWEALDAVVLETPPGDETAAGLAAAGVAIVVRSAEKPSSKWDWQGTAGRWVLRRPIAGPQHSIEPAAYAPAYAWDPGWPGGVRRRVVLCGVVFAAAATAVTLWRSRKALGILVVVSAASAVGLFAWGRRQQVTPIATGAVIVTEGGATQLDLWEYAKPLAAGQASLQWAGHTRPVFASTQHFAAAEMRLDCTAAGRPIAFHWQARRGAPMAFLSRSVRPEVVELKIAPIAADAPLRELARSTYLTAGDSLVGDAWLGPPDGVSEWTTLWPSVLVRRGN